MRSEDAGATRPLTRASSATGRSARSREARSKNLGRTPPSRINLLPPRSMLTCVNTSHNPIMSSRPLPNILITG